MGKKAGSLAERLPVPISERDTAEDKAKQWNALKEAFMREEQVGFCQEGKRGGGIWRLKP